MSTFNGLIQETSLTARCLEFPDITSTALSKSVFAADGLKVDYFRKLPQRKPPLAAFLSHVHSDHLYGLESLKAPFVYCSPATREGILERRKQHYRHLKKLLKTIPLNTPTDIELSPDRFIRVTLLDANHCVGAVMFLIQDEARAILYTGDIRSEPWWVETLLRNPVIIPYAQGLRRLDKIYLDTTFATKDRLYRRFPSKAKGLGELLQKVLQYPRETKFHFHAWTFGYEEVWIALSNAISSQSLATVRPDGNPSHEGSALFGFQCGNRHQPGCLTDRTNVRLHSCGDGTGCPVLSSPETVFIKPIISRTKEGNIIPELGVSGGGGDLTQAQDLELDDQDAAMKFANICKTAITDPLGRSAALDIIAEALQAERKTISVKALHLGDSQDNIALPEFANRLAKLANVLGAGNVSGDSVPSPLSRKASEGGADAVGVRHLPRTIEFPFSRHSSYEELCHLVSALRPIDVYPCTIDEKRWSHETSVRNLFGRYCSGDIFAHDQKMDALLVEKARLPPRKRRRAAAESQIHISEEEGSINMQVRVVGGHRSNLRQTRRSDKKDTDSAARRSNVVISTQPLASSASPDDEGLSPNLTKVDCTFKLPSPDKRIYKVRSDLLELLADAVHSPAQQSLCHGEAALRDGSPQSPRSMQKTSKKERRSTKVEPIELSSEEDTISATTAPEKRIVLFQEMPDPDKLAIISSDNSDYATDTPVSLSDAAFESQASRPVEVVEERATKIQRRKEAYKATKELGVSWELGGGYVSTNGNHGKEDLEL
ncbi:MAG: hypothetical protein Q9163_004867 [Psora crenata]